MPVWLLWFLPACEAGSWSVVLAVRRFWSRAKTRDLLLGKQPQVHLPVIDSQLKKWLDPATKNQAFVATHAVKTIRWVANTEAIEHLVLYGIQSRWPKRNQADTEVKLCL